MSDSDETVCEDTEDPMALTDSLMSPSTIPPVTRTNSTKDFCGDNERVKDLQSSPEFPPPSAKIKRLLNESWQDCTTPQLQNTDVFPTEKLHRIKGDEDKIEELLSCLELKVIKGNAFKGDSVFAEVKALMSKTKTQLCEFSRYQQQERKKITENGDELRHSQGNTGAVQWNTETKEKLIKLAAQQKMLLTLFKRHKELLEKIHTLKPKLKEGTAYSLPSVEMHWNLQDKNIQKSLGSEQILVSHDIALNNPTKKTKNSCQPKNEVSISSSPSSLHSLEPLHKPSVLSTSTGNQETVLHTAVQQTTSPKESSVSSIPTTNKSQHTLGTSSVVSTSSSLHVAPLAIKKAQQIPSTETQVMLNISQVGKFSTSQKHVPPIVVSNHQTVSKPKESESTSNSLQTVHTGNKNQGVVHNVTFTAGQWYQIGGHKVYVLPQRSITCTPSTAETQMNNPWSSTVTPVSCLSTVPQNSLPTIVPLSQESSQQRGNTHSVKSSCQISTKMTHESGLQNQQSLPQTTLPNNASWQSMTITVPAIHDQLASCSDKQINSPKVVSSAVQHLSNKSTPDVCGLPSSTLQMKQIVGVNQLMNCVPTVLNCGGVTGTSQSGSQQTVSTYCGPTVVSQGGISGTPQSVNRSTLPTVVTQEGLAGTSQSGCQQTVSTYCRPTVVSQGGISGTPQSVNRSTLPTVVSQEGLAGTSQSGCQQTVSTYCRPTVVSQGGISGTPQSVNRSTLPTVVSQEGLAGTSQSGCQQTVSTYCGPTVVSQGGISGTPQSVNRSTLPTVVSQEGLAGTSQSGCQQTVSTIYCGPTVVRQGIVSGSSQRASQCIVPTVTSQAGLVGTSQSGCQQTVSTYCGPTVVSQGIVRKISQSANQCTVPTVTSQAGLVGTSQSGCQQTVSTYCGPTVVSQGGISGTPQSVNRSTLPTVVSQEGLAGTSQSGCQQTVLTYCRPTVVRQGIVSGSSQRASQCIVPTVTSQAGLVGTSQSGCQQTVSTYCGPTVVSQGGVSGTPQSVNRSTLPTVVSQEGLAGTSQSGCQQTVSTYCGPTVVSQGGVSGTPQSVNRSTLPTVVSQEGLAGTSQSGCQQTVSTYCGPTVVSQGGVSGTPQSVNRSTLPTVVSQEGLAGTSQSGCQQTVSTYCGPTVISQGGISGTTQSVNRSTLPTVVSQEGLAGTSQSGCQQTVSTYCGPTVISQGGISGTPQSVNRSTLPTVVSQEGLAGTSQSGCQQTVSTIYCGPTVVRQGIVSGSSQRASQCIVPTVTSQAGLVGTSQSGCQQTVSTYCGPTVVSQGGISGTPQSVNQCVVPTVTSQAGTINTFQNRGEHTVPTYSVQRGVNRKSQNANQCTVPICCVATLANPVAVESTTSQSRRVYASYSTKGPVSTNQQNSFQPRGGHTLQRRNLFGSDLPDLKSLLAHSVIHAGNNVLTVQYEGRKFEASLRANGLIESAGGETFRTPSTWMRAVTGSWNTIKASHAYNMVHYKGKPLAMFTLPPIDKGCHENNNGRGIGHLHRQPQYNSELGKGALQTNRRVPQGKNNHLISTWEGLTQLLTDCQVIPVGKDELVPTERLLPSDFWDSPSDVELPQSIWKELNL